MNSYKSLAKWYDRLTMDVPYSEYANFYTRILSESKQDIKLVLDLCCGTGSISFELASRGYDLISCDKSPEMLAAAQVKCSVLERQPLFICQDASELDLYGTVDAAVCSLDSLNYIAPNRFDDVFKRLSLFIRPGGMFIFDVKTPELLRSADGDIYIDEDDSLFCVWRADWSEKGKCLIYGMDLFTSNNKSIWLRDKEEHIEYAYDREQLIKMLKKHGFGSIRVITDTTFGGNGRQFYCSTRNKN